jgi:hypothetical protein
MTNLFPVVGQKWSEYLTIPTSQYPELIGRIEIIGLMFFWIIEIPIKTQPSKMKVLVINGSFHAIGFEMFFDVDAWMGAIYETN